MSTPPTKEIVAEADKPFILCMIVTLGLVGLIIFSSIKGNWSDIKDGATLLSGLVMLSFGMYFHSKT